ncbi:hypothetical protein HDU91_006114 [Kappamyces sp. JEL0680]|nr:hypothetical protein HDU91_006114 [Kappamyces sp. JEL0680]
MRILICNDDGPPHKTFSPFIKDYVNALAALDWVTKVYVVLPANNRSWVGKGLQPTHDYLTLQYYDCDSGVVSDTRTAPTDWVLADASPAACVNLALCHLCPDVDLVLTGPNAGRNSGIQSILSSGTVGAAIEASWLGKRAISVSFGLFRESFTDRSLVAKCIDTATGLIQKLSSMWDELDKDVDVYNINIPVIAAPFQDISFVPISSGGYESLFRTTTQGSYFFRPNFNAHASPPGTDTWNVLNKRVAITPIYTNSLRTPQDLARFQSLLEAKL